MSPLRSKTTKLISLGGAAVLATLSLPLGTGSASASRDVPGRLGLHVVRQRLQRHEAHQPREPPIGMLPVGRQDRLQPDQQDDPGLQRRRVLRQARSTSSPTTGDRPSRGRPSTPSRYWGRDVRLGADRCFRRDSTPPTSAMRLPVGCVSRVELAGIEPASSSVEPGLLRVQSVIVVFSVPALAQTRRRQDSVRFKSRSPLLTGGEQQVS